MYNSQHLVRLIILWPLAFQGFDFGIYSPSAVEANKVIAWAILRLSKMVCICQELLYFIQQGGENTLLPPPPLPMAAVWPWCRGCVTAIMDLPLLSNYLFPFLDPPLLHSTSTLTSAVCVSPSSLLSYISVCDVHCLLSFYNNVPFIFTSIKTLPNGQNHFSYSNAIFRPS